MRETRPGSLPIRLYFTNGMSKTKSIYVCTQCGGSNPRWLGQCPHCKAWNTLEESVAEPAAGAAKNRFQSLAKAQPVATLSEIEASDVERQPTGIDELDRVLGGGIVEGGVVLIGGDPGIGKSTLLLQALDALSRTAKTLYVTGEESGAQVALRSRRLGLDGSQVRVLAEIQLERILAALEAEAPTVCVIDSIQTLYSEQLSSAPGSVAQVRECAAHLTRTAKATGTTVIVDIWLEFRIVDAAKAVFAVQDWDRCLQNVCSHASLAILSNKDFLHILTDRTELGENLKRDLADECARWGLEIENAFIRNVRLLPEVGRLMFETVAARLERAKARVEEEGRLRVAMLDAQTAARVAKLVADAKAQYPLQLGDVFRSMRDNPALFAAYNTLYELTQLRPHRTVAFMGFEGLRAADAAMMAPEVSSLRNSAVEAQDNPRPSAI